MEPRIKHRRVFYEITQGAGAVKNSRNQLGWLAKFHTGGVRDVFKSTVWRGWTGRKNWMRKRCGQCASPILRISKHIRRGTIRWRVNYLSRDMTHKKHPCCKIYSRKYPLIVWTSQYQGLSFKTKYSFILYFWIERKMWIYKWISTGIF